jgi:transcriptional regulator GlxA family with amidase domain
VNRCHWAAWCGYLPFADDSGVVPLNPPKMSRLALLLSRADRQAIAAALVDAFVGRSRPGPPLRGGLGPARLRTVRELVHARMEDDITLIEMAQAVELSPTYFSRMFRQSTGETPHQFVLRNRIERAKEMLHEAEVRVLDVAVACGFKTQQHFARVFRRICGASPTEYRQEWEARSPSEQHRTTIERMDLTSLLQ